MTIFEAYNHTKRVLENAGVEDVVFEAKQIVKHITGLTNTQILTGYANALTAYQQNNLEAVLQQRALRYPLQYIFGEWSFYGNDFFVGPGVLAPRPDTEILVEHCLAFLESRPKPEVLDLCAGSGCIGISLRKYADAEVTCADVDRFCLEVTEENAERNGVHVALAQGDLFKAVAGIRFDLICCNPPYLSDADLASLQEEVRHEPALALYGGADGLDYYRRIAEEYRRFLNPGGAMLLEIGAAQADPVGSMFPGADIIRDYAGLPRVLIIGGAF